MKDVFDSFRVVGIVRYTDYYPSFALCVVARSPEGPFYAQIMRGRSQTVVGFNLLEDVAGSDLEFANAPDEIAPQIGSPYVHAFIDGKGQLYIDTAEELRTTLLVALNAVDTPVSVKLNISDQIGDAEVGRQCRQELLSEFRDNFGLNSSASYENSAVRIQFWYWLDAAALNEAVRERIRRSRGRLNASISEHGSIRVEIGDIDPPVDLSLSLDEIVKRLESEFQGIGRYNEAPPRVDLSKVRNLHDPTAVAILSAVELSPRQEERIAILMRAILLHPKAGMEALTLYHDPAAFGRAATQILLHRLQPNGQLSLEINDREYLIAQLIPRLFTQSYPLRRGELLFYLSAHLAEFKIIKSAIEAVLNRSHALSVDCYRYEIERLLKAY